MVPYDEWECKVMPFSYDRLKKKLQHAKKGFEN